MTRHLTSIAASLVAYGCTAVIDIEVGAGLGASCNFDDQCQGASCIDGVCAVACGDSNGCPGGTTCADGSCQLPLRAAFVFPYDLVQDDLGRSLDIGRQDAGEQLAYLETTTDVGSVLPSDAVARVEDLAAAGFEVIVAASPTHHDAFASFAASHPDVTVLSYQGTSSAPNLISFDARTYQAYYLAGFAAGKRSAGRIGIIGSLASPPIIASINAFALGAQRAAAPATMIVELRWLGELHDTGPKVDGKSRERIFTEDLIAHGCDVIAHTLDNNIPLFTIQEFIASGMPAGVTLLGIGANVPSSCEILDAGHCLGTTYFNWGPLLSRVLDDLHRQEDPPPFVLESIQVSDSTSPVAFDVGPGLSGGNALATDLDTIRESLASEVGVGQVFAGPLESTGQCGMTPCVPEGGVLSDQGLAEMCWLVDGIVEVVPDPEMDVPAMVPVSERCPAAE